MRTSSELRGRASFALLPTTIDLYGRSHSLSVSRHQLQMLLYRGEVRPLDPGDLIAVEVEEDDGLRYDGREEGRLQWDHLVDVRADEAEGPSLGAVLPEPILDEHVERLARPPGRIVLGGVRGQAGGRAGRVGARAAHPEVWVQSGGCVSNVSGCDV